MPSSRPPVRRDLTASLWYYLKRNEKTMSALIEELPGNWVEQQGGVIGAPKAKGREKG